MEDWKERLLEEFRELDARVTNLINFLDKNQEHEDYYLLCKQLSAMIEYHECLMKCIEKYGIK